MGTPEEILHGSADASSPKRFLGTVNPEWLAFNCQHAFASINHPRPHPRFEEQSRLFLSNSRQISLPSLERVRPQEVTGVWTSGRDSSLENMWPVHGIRAECLVSTVREMTLQLRVFYLSRQLATGSQLAAKSSWWYFKFTFKRPVESSFRFVPHFGSDLRYRVAG
jgi:hypothetical protein